MSLNFLFIMTISVLFVWAALTTIGWLLAICTNVLTKRDIEGGQ